MQKKIRLGFAVGVGILIINAVIPLTLANRAAAMRAAEHAIDKTCAHLFEVLSAYKDAETGQRGFMLSGKQEFLQPYTAGRATVDALLPKLQAELQMNQQQTRRLTELLEIDWAIEQFQEKRIADRRSENWYDPEATAHGKMLMDRLRLVVAELEADERARGDALLQRAMQIERWWHVSLIAITALDLILFIIIFIVTARSMRSELSARDALTELNKNLSGEIVLRTETMSLLEQQSGRLQQIVEMQATLAAAQLNIETFRNAVVERVLALTPATGAVIEMVEDEEMVYTSASGSIAQFVGLRLPRKGSLSGLCVDEKEVMVADDTDTDPRVDRAACKKVGAASMIVAPLLRFGECVGVLKVASNKAHAFDESSLQTLRLMAGFLGAALGNQLQFQKNESLLAERSITLVTLRRELQRREEYERKILQQRQRTEAILETSHEAFICIDAQGNIREWNALAATTFGWSKEEALGKLLDELIIPHRMRAAHQKGMEHYLKTGEGPVLNKRLELTALRRDGVEIPIELTISVLRDGDNIEFPCFLRDISERKQAENTLINQRATLHAITNAIPALVSLFDINERYIYCNDEYTKIFGVPAEKIIGQTIQQFVGETVYLECKPHIDRSLAGETVVYERTMPTLIGLRHQECRHIPQFNAEGEPAGFYLIAWDITERKTQEIEWQSRASIDELTGLSNRASFTESLNSLLAHHARNHTSLAVMYLDIDRFKHVNDTYGHAAGDALLQAFAKHLQSSVRQSDVVGRFGGDEFCIVLDDIKTPANAVSVAEKILSAVQAPVLFENHTLTISSSVGIAFMKPPHFDSAQLIAAADQALYKAKQAGRNCYDLDVISA